MRAALASTLSRLPRPAASALWLAPVVTTAIALVTLGGSAAQRVELSVERSTPEWLQLLSVGGVLGLLAAAWLSGAQRPAVSRAIAVLTAGLLVPVWAGYAWL